MGGEGGEGVSSEAQHQSERRQGGGAGRWWVEGGDQCNPPSSPLIRKIYFWFREKRKKKTAPEFEPAAKEREKFWMYIFLFILFWFDCYSIFACINYENLSQDVLFLMMNAAVFFLLDMTDNIIIFMLGFFCNAVSDCFMSCYLCC